MKVYISVDMEGITGIVDASQGSAPGIDYGLGRRLMTAEAAAAAQGALDAGAGEVIVCDGHGSNGFRNILIEDLPEDAKLISGDSRSMGQMEGLDGEYDAIVLVGYHARHGKEGVLNHTINGGAIYEIRINGKAVGEFAINAYLAGHFDVPVVLVTGDNSLAEEVREVTPWIRTLELKRAVGRHAAWSLHPSRARDLIRAAVTEELEKRAAATPLKLELPAEVEIDFKYSSMADKASTLHGIRRAEGTGVRFDAPDALVAYTRILAAVDYGASAANSPMKSAPPKPPGV